MKTSIKLTNAEQLDLLESANQQLNQLSNTLGRFEQKLKVEQVALTTDTQAILVDYTYNGEQLSAVINLLDYFRGSKTLEDYMLFHLHTNNYRLNYHLKDSYFEYVVTDIDFSNNTINWKSQVKQEQKLTLEVVA